MVCCLVQELGKVRPRCFSRSMLFAATDSLEAGDVVQAALQLREAVNRFVTALCQYHDCTPRGKLCTPMMMNHALRNVEGYGKTGFRWTRDCIVLGNKAAHCRKVTQSQVEDAICMMHFMLDSCPELCEAGLRGEQPKFGWVADDDDEGDDAWIGGAI